MAHRVIKFGMIGTVVLSATAMAYGGWCVVTVTDLPESLPVGKPFTLEYVVRQHGQDATVMKGLIGGSVVAVSGAQSIKAVSTEGKDKYLATLNLPTAGPWTITINSGFTNGGVLDPILAVAAGSPAPAAELPTVRGRHLFMAKGCMTCHVNKEIPNSGFTGTGPELIRGRLGEAYVAALLADPTKATRTTGSFRMPNLGLKPAEIAALTAYLTKAEQ